MAEKKKKKGRRAYLSDYVQDLNGTYIYRGNYYVAEVPARELSRILRGILGLAVLSLLFLVGVGCLSTGTTSGAFYVTLPHVAAIILTVVCLYDTVTVLRGEGKLRSHQYEHTVSRLRGSSIISAVCAAIAAVGQTAYTIVSGTAATRAADILFLAGCYVAAVLCFLMFRIQKQIIWRLDAGNERNSIDN